MSVVMKSHFIGNLFLIIKYSLTMMVTKLSLSLLTLFAYFHQTLSIGKNNYNSLYAVTFLSNFCLLS